MLQLGHGPLRQEGLAQVDEHQLLRRLAVLGQDGRRPLAHAPGAEGILRHCQQLLPRQPGRQRLILQGGDLIQLQHLGPDALPFQQVRRRQGLIHQHAVGEERDVLPLPEPDHRRTGPVLPVIALAAPGIPVTVDEDMVIICVVGDLA